MSDAINPYDILNAARLYLPRDMGDVIDCVYIQSRLGEIYSLTAMIGSDFDTKEDFFILSRSDCDISALPIGGVWYDIETASTKVRVEYRYHRSAAYCGFDEFYEARLVSGDQEVVINREVDDFGIEKLSTSVASLKNR